MAHLPARGGLSGPAGETARRSAGPSAGRGAMATPGQPGAGPPAGRGRGSLERMRRQPAVAAGTRGRLRWAHAQSGGLR